MTRHFIFSLQILTTLLLSSFINTAKADFDFGMQYYEQAKYEKAYKAFMQVAEYGDHAAQFNIGVMLYQGQFVNADPVQAYAWLNLAAQADEFKEKGLHTQIYNALTPEQKTKADLAYQALFARLNSQTILESLTPTCTAMEKAKPILPIKQINPNFPKDLLREGKLGPVEVFFTIDKNGLTRDHSIYVSLDKKFTQVTLDALRGWQYAPILQDGQAIEATGKRVNFNFTFGGKFDQSTGKKLIESELAKAKIGDAQVQYAFAQLLSIFSSYSEFVPNKEEEEYTSTYWYTKAAKNGHALSSLLLGMYDLGKSTCTISAYQKLGWLLKASAQLVDAQYLLAVELLNGVVLEKNIEQSMYLLTKAANHNTNSLSGNAAKLRLALILSTNPDKAQRNGVLAQKYVNAVDKKYHDKQNLFQTAAAVAAENGDFTSAVDWQEQAFYDARKLDLPLDKIQAQIDAYKSKQTRT